MMEKSVELPTCTSEVQSFQSSGDGSGGLNQSTNVPSSSSEILRTTDLSNKIDYMSSIIPFSEDNRSLSAVITSQPDSLNAMLPEAVLHNGTRDWPSSFGKSAAEVKQNYLSIFQFHKFAYIYKFCAYRLQIFFLAWNPLMTFSPKLQLVQVSY